MKFLNKRHNLKNLYLPFITLLKKRNTKMEIIFKSSVKVSNLHKLVFELFCSYFLTMVLLALLMLLVFLGTLAQVELGLFQTQQMFFNSLTFLYPVNDFLSIPLPGVYLLLVLLFVNLVCGGIIRLKYSKRTVGILVVHLGVLALLLSAMVSFHFSSSGFITLKEGESQNYYESWEQWDLLITEISDSKTATYRLPINSENVSVAFTDLLPFELKVSKYVPNASIVRSQGDSSVDGFAIKSEKLKSDISLNVPALLVEIDGKLSIFWGGSVIPYVIMDGDREWQIELVRQRHELPFDLTLDKFSVGFHPNTQNASFFESRVSIDGKNETLIQMNEPLRKEGVAIFQASYDVLEESKGKVRFRSTLSTVYNPSDHWPLYACIILGIGLLIHFLPMLISFVKSSGKGGAL
jgi:hypothetical protein